MNYLILHKLPHRGLVRRLFLMLAFLLVIPASYAFESFVVKEIRVEGLQRISVGTVFNYLPIRINEKFTSDRAKESLRALFKTGFFKDIRLAKEGSTLLVRVVERPSILSIDIDGSKKIPPEDLKKTLKEAGLGEGRTFNRSLLDRVQLDLKRQYYSLGYYAVKIDHTIKPKDQNRIAIEFKISEGRIALIEDIRIVGNEAFVDKKLLGLFQLQTRAKTKMPFSKKDRYSRQKLEGDLESLRNKYHNAGYMDFTINSTQVSVTPDREYVYLTISVTEGKQYRISSHFISGETIVGEKEIEKLITIEKGEIFSRKKIIKIVTAINGRLGDEGYAFAQANAIPEIDRENAEVSFTYTIVPGKRAYIRRINISGNNITRDSVIRREMRQLEGTWFSRKKLDRSRVRLQRLGYFASVDLKTKPVAGSEDQIDIDITVKEQSTGSITMGAGYSDLNGVFVNVAYNERNAFGTGKDVRISFDNSQATTTYEFRYNNPYHTLSGINRGFELYSRAINATVSRTGNYGTETNGLGVFYGFPVSETRKINAGLAYENNNLDVTMGPTGSAQVAQTFVSIYGTKVSTLKATLGWSHDTLNNFIFATQGGLIRLSAEGGIPGGDLEYYQASLRGSYYFPLTDERSTVRFRGELAYGDGYGNTTELPFFKNYFAGGANSVRGFRARGLGPTDSITSDPIGGNKLLVGSAEYLFPVPGSPEQGSSMRLSLFVDAGMVYGATETLDPGTLRYSAGIGFNWFTAVFPISLSYGIPLNAQPGDLIENFQFNIGLPLQ